jgi:hypothetical protein
VTLYLSQLVVVSYDDIAIFAPNAFVRWELGRASPFPFFSILGRASPFEETFFQRAPLLPGAWSMRVGSHRIPFLSRSSLSNFNVGANFITSS